MACRKCSENVRRLKNDLDSNLKPNALDASLVALVD
jgi:hypothetical protein